MANRILGKDIELNEAFEIAPPPEGAPTSADSLGIVVRCKACIELHQKGTLKGSIRSWEVELDSDGAIDRGSRAALLTHANAHSVKPKMRRIS